MTRNEILNMPAGREMDALIAKEVFGLDVKHDWHWQHTTQAYTTEIGAAWKVVDKLVRFSITIESFPKGVLCRFFGAGQTTAGDAVGWADTAPLAICRAALLAVEAE